VPARGAVHASVCDPALLKPVDPARGLFRYQGALFDSHKARSSVVADPACVPAK
jgi:hypothetical protein